MSSDAPAPACPNCETPTHGRYCPGCGQDNRVSRLDARRISSELLENFTGWDSALARTMHCLLVSPGRLVADYVSGRRRRFVNPARFCLLSLAFWFLASRMFLIDPLDASGIRITGSSGGEAAQIANDVREFIGRNLNVLFFLSLPLRAFLLRFFFRRTGRNVAECMVLVLYVAGFGYLLGMVSTPLLLRFDQEYVIRGRFLLSLIWFYWAAWGFFQLGWWATLWRGLLVSLLHVIGTFLFFGLVSIPWVMLTR